MLGAFIAVLDELIEFVFSGFKVEKSETQIVPTQKKEMEPIKFAAPKTNWTPLLNGQTAYIIKDGAVAWSRPVVAFDTSVGVFLYGEKVSVISSEGNYVLVDSRLQKVWLEVRDITYSDEDVHPKLINRALYYSDADATKKIRMQIKDECAGARLHLPLQSVEYIIYKLSSINVAVDWGTTRPRLAGLWQKILKGRRGVHISIEPKTGSIMEYFNESQKGILGFVEQVHPDNSILISSVGRNTDGEYLEERLEANEWRELRPIFITIT